ncbi:protein ANTI-SILENCING 1-like isoform X2 [Tripterygium wilfordii]|uniref:protein ANTI-SILENCING 1-like isoform X2 n=1 Tax=Tripterygium wilfordii TaxID=458696 RepID=UPI0018F849EA|nr:protein ANTI-SILENCING 1-like isoform X2 [Tripterygium wilfordii]
MERVDDGENVEFRWGKKRGIGGKKKDVRFYESFNYDNVEYTLYDCVYLYKEGEPEPFIGKLIKIWETSDKTRRIKVLWFFRPCEILNYLGAEAPLDNELFLASGDGVGLTNINPLEAIAGKCNVVCISKDERNLQPSDEQVRLADFIFYRTFDVGLCEISDKINEKIAGIEDKNTVCGDAIQRADGKARGNAIPRADGVEIDSDENKVSGNAVPRAETVILSKKDTLEEHRTLKTQDSLTKMKSTLRENYGSSVYVESSEIDKRNDLPAKISSEKTSLNSKAKENADLKVSLDKQKSIPQKAASVGVQSGEVTTTNDRLGNTSGEKTNTRLNVNENSEQKASSIKQKSPVGEKPSSNVAVKLTEKDSDIRENMDERATSSFKVDCNRNQGKVCKVIVNEVDDENKVNSTGNLDILECRPSKRPKLDNPVKVFEEKNENHVQNLGHDPKTKASTKGAPISEEKSKSKPSKTENSSSNKPKVEEKLPAQSDGKLPKATSSRQPLEEEKTIKPQRVVISQIAKIENGPFKKPKLDEKHDGKLPKESTKQPLDEENTIDHQVVEANRRPDVDRRNWFKELPWEERMQTAYKQGTLVLLENLDPAYTSVEVEDIVSRGFKTSCTAKMIQQTAYSSPHFGQALVIFKTKEAAQELVRKLHKGCLLICNERPLVGRIVNPSFPGKQSTFVGHLVIDKLRAQMQREMKEAVSTSHCSQPNTLEYDMAMEWCLLQERWDCTWKKLHQQQGKELEELKSNLKLRL